MTATKRNRAQPVDIDAAMRTMTRVEIANAGPCPLHPSGGSPCEYCESNGLPQATKGERIAAAEIWDSVVRLIEAGTPIDGIESIARHNSKTLRHAR